MRAVRGFAAFALVFGLAFASRGLAQGAADTTAAPRPDRILGANRLVTEPPPGQNPRPMDVVNFFVDWLLHLDQRLAELVEWAGPWTSAVLFLIVFCETGLVVTPFLPGDSLLFAAGTFAALGSLDVRLLILLLAAAAILGDTVNYWIGRKVGPRAFSGNIRFLKREHLVRTQAFYERHGGKTIILARFVPIVRTYVPFVAGVGAMPYARYLTFCVIGALVWVVSLCTLGYWFGNQPVVKNNLTAVILIIVAVSITPGFVAWVKSRRQTA